jgi:hypothetical protein
MDSNYLTNLKNGVKNGENIDMENELKKFKKQMKISKDSEEKWILKMKKTYNIEPLPATETQILLEQVEKIIKTKKASEREYLNKYYERVVSGYSSEDSDYEDTNGEKI